MRDTPRWPRAFNLNHTAKLIGIARMHKWEVTGRSSGEKGRQYDEEGISSREGSSRGGQDWGCDTSPPSIAPQHFGHTSTKAIITNKVCNWPEYQPVTATVM